MTRVECLDQVNTSAVWSSHTVDSGNVHKLKGRGCRDSLLHYSRPITETCYFVTVEYPCQRASRPSLDEFSIDQAVQLEQHFPGLRYSFCDYCGAGVGR